MQKRLAIIALGLLAAACSESTAPEQRFREIPPPDTARAFRWDTLPGGSQEPAR